MSIQHKPPKKGTITPESIATRWGIGLRIVQRTYEATTQLGIRDFSESKGSKRLKHTAYQTCYRRLRADAYMDMIFADTKSLSQNT